MCIRDSRYVVPHVAERIVAQAQVEPVQLPAERREPVVQRPEGRAALRAREHVLLTACGHRVTEQREHRHELRRRLDVEVVHVHAGDNALRVIPDRPAQLPQREEDPHPVVVEVRAGFQRRGVAAGRLEVAVVLSLPVVYAVELGRYAVLEQGRLRLPLDLLFDLPVYRLVALGQRHPFQRVGGCDLSPGLLRQQAGERGEQTEANDS